MVNLKIYHYFNKILQILYGLSLKKIIRWIKSVEYLSREKVYSIDGKYAKNLKLNIKKNFKQDYVEMISGEYENFMFDCLGDFKLEGKTVWDIGAHFGYHSLIFSDLVGKSGRVYSFEPNPNNTVIFEKNIKSNEELGSRIVLNNCAISDSSHEHLIFRISPFSSGPTTLGGFLDENSSPVDDRIYDRFKKISVAVKNIDSLISEGLIAPDLIKIDIEGAEYKALLGATETLKNKQPILIIEIHNIVCMAMIAEFLRRISYEYKIIDGDNPIFTKNILAKPAKI